MKSNKKIISILKAIIFVLVGFVALVLITYFVVNKDSDDKTQFTTYKGIDSTAKKKDSKKKKAKESESEIDESDENNEQISDIVGETESGEEAGIDQEIEKAESSTETTESTSSQNSAGAYDAQVDEILSKMSIHDKICQLFIVTPEALTGVGQVTEAGNATKDSLKKYPVGGVIYFSSNLESAQQTKDLLSNTKSMAEEINGIPIFLAVDEEGGTVARCAEKLGVTKFNDMYTIRSYRG